MGVDYMFYIGPYAQYVSDLVDKESFCFSNPSGEGKFCSNCGSSIRKSAYKAAAVDINVYDDELNLDDALDVHENWEDKTKRIYYLMPNKEDGLNSMTIDAKHFPESSVDMSDLSVQDEINVFKSFYKEELDIVCKYYKIELTYHWGLIHWAG